MHIYLISESGGAAYARTKKGAQALESVGYVRCSKEEYRKRMQKINREDGTPADIARWLAQQDGSEEEE